MARKRPTRRRQPLEIEPLNWIAPDNTEEQGNERIEQDESENDKKSAKK